MSEEKGKWKIRVNPTLTLGEHLYHMALWLKLNPTHEQHVRAL